MPETGAIHGVLEDSAPEATVVGYYNLQGVRLSEPVRGINIAVYSDGITRKVVK